MKVMIFAAGRGERLRPLTERIPKPLIAVAGKPLLLRHLERLAEAGYREAVINVSHLAQQIIERIGAGERVGMRIEYSKEAEPLETAGGLAYARELLGEEPFLLVNSDIYCDYDYGRLAGHELGGKLAHLVLVPNPAHHEKGDFSLQGDALGTAASPRHTYSGIAVMSPALVAQVPAGSKAPLGPMLVRAAANGQLSGELYEGLWSDVGTVERLSVLEQHLVDGLADEPSRPTDSAPL